MMERAEQVPRPAARLEDLLRVGRRPERERLVPRLRHRHGVPRAGRRPSARSTRRSRRRSPPTRASRCPGFDQRAAAPRDVGPAAKANPDVNILVYHSGYDIGDTQKAYRGDAEADSDTNTVDGLIKSLRENKYDATALPQEGQEVRQRPERLRRARLGLARRDARPGPGRPPARQADQPRRARSASCWGTDSLWYGSPQPEIVALRRFEFTEQGQGALRAAVRARGRRRGPDAQGAAARRGRSATASSAATPPRPTRSTRTRSATRSTATR